MPSLALKVRFQVSCNHADGFGHLRRCLVLAQAFELHGVQVIFGVSDQSNATISKYYNVDCLALDTINSDEILYDILIVDGYRFTIDEMTNWREKAKLSVMIDDVGTIIDGFDIILNPNIYGHEVDYSQSSCPKILVGPIFNLIDSGFFVHPEDVSQKDGIVVSFGGSDRGEMSAKIALELAKKTNTLICCPIPKHQSPHQDLIEASEKFVNIKILIGADMRELLLKADIFIGGLGVTVSEAIAAQCKIVVCSLVDNQELNRLYLKELGVGVFHSFDSKEMAEAALSRKNETLNIHGLHASGSSVVVQHILATTCE